MFQLLFVWLKMFLLLDKEERTFNRYFVFHFLAITTVIRHFYTLFERPDRKSIFFLIFFRGGVWKVADHCLVTINLSSWTVCSYRTALKLTTCEAQTIFEVIELLEHRYCSLNYISTFHLHFTSQKRSFIYWLCLYFEHKTLKFDWK